MSWLSLAFQLSIRAAINPPLALDLIRVTWRFRTRRWYFHPPFLPLPAMTYIRWRMLTVYGDHHAVPPVADVIRYVRWAGRQKNTA